MQKLNKYNILLLSIMCILNFECTYPQKSMNTQEGKELQGILIAHIGMTNKYTPPILFSSYSEEFSTKMINNIILKKYPKIPKYHIIDSEILFLIDSYASITTQIKEKNQRLMAFGEIEITFLYKKGFEDIYISKIEDSKELLKKIIKKMDGFSFKKREKQIVEQMYCYLNKKGWPCQ